MRKAPAAQNEDQHRQVENEDGTAPDLGEGVGNIVPTPHARGPTDENRDTQFAP